MSELIVNREGLVATVTLNRPAAMNALSKSLRGMLATAMADLNDDPTVSVVILTGAGERAFSAGLDLKELGSDADALDAASATSALLNPVQAIERCRKPVIGAINGVAITGGFELALACDILIASSNTRFADTHVRVGIMPGWGLSQKLSRLIGPYRAKELSLSGNFLDASTAQAWGLVNRVVAPSALMAVAGKLASDIAQGEPGMLEEMKRLIDDGYSLSLGDGLALETERSTGHNRRVGAGDVEKRRREVQARGRSQQAETTK
jgi:enoyl-CoA hydratase